MTATSRNRWRRQTALALSVVFGVLAVSCDERALPTQPTVRQPFVQQGPQAPRSTGPIAFVSDRDGTERIYLANEDGSGVTPLVATMTARHVINIPAWAKDGRQIAYSREGDIRVIGVDSSGDRVLARRGWHPAWSPDGRSLMFVGNSGGISTAPTSLELVNVDGSNRRTLFSDGGYASFPKWSPDGQKILYVADGGYVDSCFGLWTVNADGSGARQLGGPGVGRPSASCSFVEASLSDGYWPVWSPDGSEIAFVSGPGPEAFSIHVIRADGSGRRLRVPAPATYPDWTPDGRLIYTKGRWDGPSRIFISDGGTERQLIPEATAPARPSYHDSQAVWLR
jgi:Tol biopolymer transport system component